MYKINFLHKIACSKELFHSIASQGVVFIMYIYSPVEDVKVHGIGGDNDLHLGHKLQDAVNGEVCLGEKLEVPGDEGANVCARQVSWKLGDWSFPDCAMRKIVFHATHLRLEVRVASIIVNVVRVGQLGWLVCVAHDHPFTSRTCHLVCETRCHYVVETEATKLS